VLTKVDMRIGSLDDLVDVIDIFKEQLVVYHRVITLTTILEHQ